MIGSDGGHFLEPIRMSRIRLSPVERAEIVVDASHGYLLQLLARFTVGVKMGNGWMRDEGGSMGRGQLSTQFRRIGLQKSSLIRSRTSNFALRRLPLRS